MSKRAFISRRTVLRGALAGGALVTIPLPRLGAMLNSNGTAYAAGQTIRRFGIYFIGNGFVPASFAPLPRRTGPLGELTTQLAPFANVKEKLTVVSGFDLHTGRTLGVPHGHFPGGLCGAAATPERVYQLPSIDQVIARGPLGVDVPYKSLEVGVSNATPGVSQNIYHAVSQAGPNQPNYPEFSATKIFDRLFRNGVTTNPQEPPPADPRAVIEKSVLDAVLQDATKLNQRLGVEDRARLESHMASIRAVEKRISAAAQPGAGALASCMQPGTPMDGRTSGDGLDGELAKTMADLVVMALACDLTRVFTFMLTKPSAHVNYASGPGLSGDFHGICHGDEGDEQPTVQRGVAYSMGYFADLLQKMDAIPEGAGTLLDNSTVLLSSCVSWGKTHTQWEWPCLIAGRGGLREDGSFNFQGNWHYRSFPSSDNFSKVLLTLANINEANLEEIGKDGGHVTDEVQGIRGPT